MTDFEQRLRKAVERGQRRGQQQSREQAEKALSEDQLRTLHTRYRLQLSEHIEQCVSRLADHFPGFRFETVFGERGWGAACSRDDVNLRRDARDSRRNDYSRLEMTIRPFSDYHVLELTAKGTIRNKEVYNRTHFEKLADADADTFMELIDVWVLEYAELYAAST